MPFSFSRQPEARVVTGILHPTRWQRILPAYAPRELSTEDLQGKENKSGFCNNLFGSLEGFKDFFKSSRGKTSKLMRIKLGFKSLLV